LSAFSVMAYGNLIPNQISSLSSQASFNYRILNSKASDNSINTVNSFATSTVNVGNSPEGVAYDSASNTIYVANTGSNNVSVISGSTNHVIATVYVGSAPYAVAYDPTNNSIYVADSSSGSITIISGATTNYLLIGIIIVIVVILAVLVSVLVMRRGKKKGGAKEWQELSKEKPEEEKK
ncbi:MAG: hypothetical protein QXU98_14010, partial [Candidatus Parvarchaeota archaeon]